MSDILGCVINWRRPFNIERVLRAMREQTAKLAKLVLIECAPHSEFAAPPQARAIADCVIEINENIGPISRLLAPLAFPQYRYTYFGVDDWLPGPRHVEWMLQTAAGFHDNFATIGQDGRYIRDGAILHRKARPDPLAPTKIDVITSSELMLTRTAAHVMRWRENFLNSCGRNCSILEDDLFICMGAQQLAGYPSYLTPEPPSGHESWRSVGLKAPHALCGRENHHEIRDHFVRCAQEFGWRSRVNQVEFAGYG